MNQRVIAITGAFGNLGVAVTKALARHGARLALIDRAQPTQESQQHDALILNGVNLSHYNEAMQAVEKVVNHYGRLDGLINIAGTFRWQTLEHGDVDTWDFLYAVNLKTAVAMSKAALPHLLKAKGRIVNIAAGVAVGKAGTGMGAYAASKAGVVKLTESLSDEVKERGVTVNAILPSIIDTPQNRQDMPDADFTRWVTPQSIADVIVFLLSDQAASITGATVPVYGKA